jgi:hypothetical protein
MSATTAKPGPLYWLTCAVLLLWALGGASIYVAYFVETPDQFASTAETAANREAYAGYIEEIPAWAIGAGIIAAVARLLGAVSLLLRRAWALPLYLISILFFAVALYRAFVLAGVAEVMNPAHIAVEAAFVALSLFAIWFAYTQKANGVLK